MPRIGSFGLSRRTKYKLELNHVIRVAINKHVFGETKFTYLRVTSMCSQKNSAERKTRNQATFGNNCFLFRFICDAKNKRWTKSGRELGPTLYMLRFQYVFREFHQQERPYGFCRTQRGPGVVNLRYASFLDRGGRQLPEQIIFSHFTLLWKHTWNKCWILPLCFHPSHPKQTNSWKAKVNLVP